MNNLSTVLKHIKVSGQRRAGPAPRARQAGVYAVEFAIVAFIFFVMVFTILEVSRALYMWNTLQEVTRRAARAASVTDFTDATAMDKLRYAAVFRNAAGGLAMGKPIGDKHVRIDYLSMQHVSNSSSSTTAIPAASLPGCPARNRLVCTKDSGDPSCIRLVRVRICQPGGAECTPIPYQTLFPLVSLPMTFPVATSIVRAESLGYVPGMPMCN